MCNRIVTVRRNGAIISAAKELNDMKKKLSCAVIIITMLFSSVLPAFGAAKLARPVIEEVEAGKNSIKIDWTYVKHSDGYDVYRSTSQDGTYKYIINTGAKYHNYGCRHLHSCIAVTYSYAVSAGYTACKVCH